MNERYSVGVDIGGSSAKAAVYALDGRVMGSGSVSYRPNQPSPGVVEYDPQVLIDAAEQSIAEAMRSSGVSAADIVAVCCDAMISGTVGLDSAGRATTAYTTTLDTRFNTHLERMSQHEARIRSLVGSGTPVVAAKIAWYREADPDAFARTSVFVLAGGLIGGHLAGLGADEAFIDPTVLWAVGLSDTAAAKWSTELIERAAVPPEVLPRIVSSTTVVGGVTDGVARRTGLRSGTPVVAGCGDQMAGFLGAGVVRSDAIGDSAGTYEVVGRRVDSFTPNAHCDLIPSALGDGFVQQSVIAIGAGFTRGWFESRVATDWTSGTALDLDALAANAPVGSDGLVFIPHLGGQDQPSRPWVRGGWLGLGWDHDAGHLARSLMEAMACELAGAIEDFGGAAPGTQILGYGGGARSPVAGQIKADVTGLSYSSLGDISPTTLAAAMVGAIATGHLDSLDQVIAATAPITERYEPDRERHAAYVTVLRDYREATELAARFRKPPPITPTVGRHNRTNNNR